MRLGSAADGVIPANCRHAAEAPSLSTCPANCDQGEPKPQPEPNDWQCPAPLAWPSRGSLFAGLIPAARNRGPNYRRIRPKAPRREESRFPPCLPLPPVAAKLATVLVKRLAESSNSYNGSRTLHGWDTNDGVSKSTSSTPRRGRRRVRGGTPGATAVSVRIASGL